MGRSTPGCHITGLQPSRGRTACDQYSESRIGEAVGFADGLVVERAQIEGLLPK